MRAGGEGRREGRVAREVWDGGRRFGGGGRRRMIACEDVLDASLRSCSWA